MPANRGGENVSMALDLTPESLAAMDDAAVALTVFGVLPTVRGPLCRCSQHH
jgi:hypothetical protein